jgi:hypothetical protein
MVRSDGPHYLGQFGLVVNLIVYIKKIRNKISSLLISELQSYTSIRKLDARFKKSYTKNVPQAKIYHVKFEVVY